MPACPICGAPSPGESRCHNAGSTSTDDGGVVLSHVQAELETLREERLRIGARIVAFEDERQLLAVTLLAGVPE